MKNFKILSEPSAINYLAEEIPPTCVVSITNPERENIRFQNINIIDVLYLKFADSLYKGRMTEEDANAIIDFFIKNKDSENYVIHCRAGQSRSAAVGAVMMSLFNDDDSPVWNNSYMLPNRWCYYFLKLQVEMRDQGIDKKSNPFNPKMIQNIDFRDDILNWCYIDIPRKYIGYGLLLEPNDDTSVRMNDGLYGTGFSVQMKDIKKNQLFILPSIEKRMGDY